jgi:hypothetical protein
MKEHRKMGRAVAEGERKLREGYERKEERKRGE